VTNPTVTFKPMPVNWMGNVVSWGQNGTWDGARICNDALRRHVDFERKKVTKFDVVFYKSSVAESFEFNSDGELCDGNRNPGLYYSAQLKLLQMYKKGYRFARIVIEYSE